VIAELQRETTGEIRFMAVKIKLTRLGKIRNPQYRIAVADARNRRDGRAIEVIGRYHPKEDPSLIEVDSDRAQYWLSVGAQPTEPVLKLLKITGDWQKFKGLPGQEGTLKVAAPKESKVIAYEAAVQQAADEPKTPTPRKVAEKVADAAVAGAVAEAAAEAAVIAEAEAVVEIAEANAGEVSVVEAEVAVEAAAEADAIADAAAVVADEAVAEAVEAVAESTEA
jgi:small subunit ribosomal protein S16